MSTLFSKDKIINSTVSSFDNYCVGYSGKGNYLTALVMGIGSFKRTFSHPGSKRLDSIIAYDRAEVSDAYIGQINMSMVSSFCGPQGLIWGYDVAREEGEAMPSFLSLEKLEEFGKIKIRNGKNLREAAKSLFGSNEKRNFPLLPGAHVPCAGKFEHEIGPIHLYGAIAIGIPEDRGKAACLLMEDVGKIIAPDGNVDAVKEKIFLNSIRSILEVGKNQKVEYTEIFIDLISEEIGADKTGCVLVAMTYFLLAKKAFTKNLTEQNLSHWAKEVQPYFLNNQ